jgi:hypothetical protein
LCSGSVLILLHSKYKCKDSVSILYSPSQRFAMAGYSII